MSKKAVVLFAEGYEEVEALAVVDVLRRGGVEVVMLSVDGSGQVTSSHQVTVQMDAAMDGYDMSSVDALILPGGMPGTTNLKDNPQVIRLVQDFDKENKLVAAICAAPTVLAEAGILDNRIATCHPGHEEGMHKARIMFDDVVEEDNVITSRGAGTALEFGLAIVTRLTDKKVAKKIRTGLVM